jgi:hypothetical protein
MSNSVMILILVGIVTTGVTIYFIVREIRKSIVKFPDQAADVSKALINAPKDFLDSLKKRKEMEKTIRELEIKKFNLETENKELKGRHIDVSHSKAILELALFEQERQITQKNEKIIDYIERSFRKDIRKKYIGIIQLTYKQKLGVDLMDLRFRILDQNTIEVSGLNKLRSLGISLINGKQLTEHLYCKIHDEYVSSASQNSPSEIQVNLESDVSSCIKEQEEVMYQEINKVDNNVFAKQIENISLQFIKMIFGKSYDIKISDSIEKGLNFTEICEVLNQKFENVVLSNNNIMKSTDAEIENIKNQLYNLELNENKMLNYFKT